MKLKAVLLSLVIFCTFSCGGTNRAGDWEEYDAPCYANQQPNYTDGDYYIYNCDGRYRRVRREYVHYPVPIYIPVVPDYERENIYRTMPRRSTVPPSRQSSTSPDLTSPSRSQPSTVPSSRTKGTSNPATSKPSTVPSSRSTAPASKSSSPPSRSTVPSSRRP